jgi:hypothetical protein
MKESYIVKIRNTHTNEIRVRELLIDEKKFNLLTLKIGKIENGFLLLEITRIYN